MHAYVYEELSGGDQKGKREKVKDTEVRSMEVHYIYIVYIYIYYTYIETDKTLFESGGGESGNIMKG
jgi:hypothetical protein